MDDNKPIHVGRRGYPEPERVYPPFDADAAYVDDEEFHILDYLRVLLARRWTVIAVTLTVVIIGTISTFKAVPIYSASASLQIDREDKNILSFQDIYELDGAADDRLQTQFKVLESRTLARRVIEELGLDETFEDRVVEPGLVDSIVDAFRGLFTQEDRVVTAEPDPLRSIIDDYLSALNIEPVRLSRLANISFESEDPELATTIINAHGKLFIEQNLQFKWDATQQASEFLSGQLVSLKASLEKAEDQLQEFSRDNEILFIQEGLNTATSTLQQLDMEFTRAQADRFLKESYERLVGDGSFNALPFGGDNQTSGIIGTLSVQLTELRRDEAELAVTFSPEYPRRERLTSQIKEIERAIDEAKTRIVEMVRNEYLAAFERERLLAAALQEQRNAVNRINQQNIQYGILKREVDSSKELYDGLLMRLKEAGISAGLRASNIRVVDRAEVPVAPIRPRKRLNIFISFLLGLTLGVGLAFIQEYVDSSLKSTEDVTRLLGVPALGTIPRLSSTKGRTGSMYGYRPSGNSMELDATKVPEVERIAFDAPASLMSEAYRSARTSLLFSSPNNPPQSVVIVSALASEGKTVTAVNTAISLTQAGARVVLVDGDMRKPRLHRIFSLSGTEGLATFLTGASELKDSIHMSDIPNMSIMPCGVVPPNPAELLLSPRFRSLMEALGQYFDHIVIDSPPLANVSDGRIIGSSADGVILVVKAFSTSRYVVKRAIDHLNQARAKIAGVILNDLDVRGRGTYYSQYPDSYSYYSQHSGQA